MVVEIAPLFIPGGFGPMELARILVLVMLLLGASKIPELTRSTGEAMGEFKKGRQKAEQELEEIRNGEASIETDSDSAAESEPEPVSTPESESEAETEPSTN